MKWFHKRYILFHKWELSWNAGSPTFVQMPVAYRYFWILVGMMPVLQAQHPRFVQVHMGNGLPVNVVYQLAQDAFGMLWMATPAGLYRYDGIQSIHYPVPENPGLGMVNVFADEQGGIWTRSDGGNLYRVTADSLLPVMGSLPPDFRYAVPDTKGGYVVFYADTLLQVPVAGTPRKFLCPIPSINGTIVTDIVCNDTVVDIAVSGHGIVHLSLATGQSSLVTPLTRKQHARICRTSAGLLWVRTDVEDHSYLIQLWNNKGVTVRVQGKFTRADERWYRLAPAGTDRLWACTSNGLLLVGQEYGSAGIISRWFTGYNVSSVLTDHEGNLWVSTLNQGIFMIPDTTIRSYQPGDESGGATALCPIPGQGLLAGMDNGDLYLLRPSSRSWEPAFVDPKFPFSLPVRSILCEQGRLIISRGKVSFGTIGSRQQQVSGFSNFRDMALSGDTLLAVLSDRIIWIRLSDLMAGGTKYDILLPQGGTSVEYDPEHRCWYIAAAQGTFRYADGILEEMHWSGKSFQCRTICRTSRGVFATPLSGGLIRLDGSNVVPLEVPPGTGGQLFRVLAAASDTVYFTTDRNLGWLIPETGAYSLARQTAGLPTLSIQTMAIYGKTLWIGTSLGLVSMPSAFVTGTTLLPPIRISRIRLNGISLPVTDSVLSIPAGPAHFEIMLEGIHFQSHGAFGYRYRLSGLDSLWNDIPGSANLIQFPSLPPGNYIFEAYTRTADGLLSGQPVRLYLFVEAPFFQRPLAIALLLIAAILLTTLVFSFILRLIRRRHRLRQQLVLSQLTALKAQMNPHFMFNTLNSIQDLVLTQDFKASNLYLTKFSSLMRLVLDGSGKELVRLDDEIEMLKLYLDLEKLRFGDDLTCHIQIDPVLDISGRVIPSMVIQPFVENALKHGLLHRKGNKLLELVFEGADHLVCIIRDNGIGRAKSAEIRTRRTASASFSTQATRRRLDLLQSLYGSVVHLEIIDLTENGVATGTEVRLHLPFMKPS